MLRLDFSKYPEGFKEEYSKKFEKIKNVLRQIEDFLREENIDEHNPSILILKFVNDNWNDILISDIGKLEKELKKLKDDKNVQRVLYEVYQGNSRDGDKIYKNFKKRDKDFISFNENGKFITDELKIDEVKRNLDWFVYVVFRRVFIKYGYENVIVDKLAYKIAELLDIKTCPYCNENLAYTIDGINIRPQLDHFFPKSKYPFFAISLANLIPSCYVCNKKKEESFNEALKSPFEINSFEDFSFTFIPDIDAKALTSIRLNDIENNIYVDFIKEVKANTELFSLRERYEQHRDIVAEVIQKQRLINYYKEKMDSDVLGVDFPSSEEEYRLIYCNYYPSSEEEFLRRPLSKLTFDIYEELNNPP